MPRCKRGKSLGTQVQHTLGIGTDGTEFRQFLASDCGTVWTITKSARTFAPLTLVIVVAFVEAEVLRLIRRRLRPLNRYRLDGLAHQRVVVAVGAVDHRGQRHATAIRQHRALDPALAAIGRIAAGLFVTQRWCLARGAIQRQPCPLDAVQCVIGEQSFAPEGFKNTGSGPFLEAPVRPKLDWLLGTIDQILAEDRLSWRGQLMRLKQPQTIAL